jgi:hypothetical protein
VTTIIGNNLGWNKNALIGWARKMAMKGIDPYKERDKAGTIGTLAHKLIEYHLHRQIGDDGWEVDFLDDYAPNDIEKAQKGFEAFLEWEELVSLEPLKMEERLVSEWYQFGGTIDLQANVNGKFSLVDFKTSNGLWPEHVIQLSAYEKLMLESGSIGKGPEDVYILHLPKDDADFHAKPFYDLENYWRVFVNLRNIEYHREELTKN